MLSSASFRDYLFSSCGYENGSSVLAAVSGGLDSVVLAHLLNENKIPFGIAHVNYGLRGDESDADEQFVADLAKTYNVPFILKKCSEEDFSLSGENSIQFSARKIRYAFFETTSIQQGYALIATAHHVDDSIETALLNFARGTGISGLRSIQAASGKIIRPLLQFSRTEILAYANAHQLKWREDSSNDSDKYSRNRFRHHLLPWLLEQIPQHYSGFKASFARLEETEILLKSALKNWGEKCCVKNDGEIKISLAEMNKFPEPILFLKFFLRENNFSDAQLSALNAVVEGEPGAKLISNAGEIIRDRDHLFFITENKNAGEHDEDFFYFTKETFGGKILKEDFSVTVDATKIQLPFQVRLWKDGDKMIPFGMKGHKNVSDILNELKLPAHRKEKAIVVLSGDEIVWVPGYRIAEKFKVSPSTSTVLNLFYNSSR